VGGGEAGGRRPEDFAGIAVTRPGRAWFGAARELRQAPEGGEDRVLAERNRRDDSVAATERAHGAERTAGQEAERASAAVAEADAGSRRNRPRAARRRARARRLRGGGAPRRVADRAAPVGADEGPSGLRRAEVEAALAAERRLAEQAEHARAVQEERLASARAQLERCRALGPAASGSSPRWRRPRRGSASASPRWRPS
jgi:chromosome segregation protein